MYTIPADALDTALSVIADTTAMSEPKEIEYTITFASDSLMKYVLGDVTGDNEVTADDLTALSRHVAKIIMSFDEQ